MARTPRRTRGLRAAPSLRPASGPAGRTPRVRTDRGPAPGALETKWRGGKNTQKNNLHDFPWETRRLALGSRFQFIPTRGRAGKGGGGHGWSRPCLQARDTSMQRSPIFLLSKSDLEPFGMRYVGSKRESDFVARRH